MTFPIRFGLQHIFNTSVLLPRIAYIVDINSSLPQYSSTYPIVLGYMMMAIASIVALISIVCFPWAAHVAEKPQLEGNKIKSDQ